MDNDPSNLLSRALARDMNGLLEQDGMIMGDREIVIQPEMVQELDITDIVVGRNDEYRRTVCHIHRPPTQSHYWRHETYVAWDDGRTAWFDINLALSEPERQILETLRTCHHELLGEFDVLLARSGISKSTAEEIYDGILTELERLTQEVNEIVLKDDVVRNSPSKTAIEMAIDVVDASAPIGDAPSLEYERVYAAARRLRAAHYDGIKLRAELIERYVELSSLYLDEAEADPASSAPPEAIWELLDILDKIR